MPFTVSHVAAVVPAYRPLSRARLFSAAVIGSMVPDFGLLLPGSFARWQTHSLTALLSFCLPVGLAAYAFTQWLIKPAVLEVLPDGPYARLRAQPRRTALQWLGVPLALLLGALTHLIWDGFTHENARGVQLFPELLDYGPQMAGHSLRLYMWLQYGSSVAGLGVVAAGSWLWLRHSPAPRPAPPRRLAPAERGAWLAAYLALPLAGLAWFTLRPLVMHGVGPLSWAVGRTAVMSLRSATLSLLLVSALIRLRLLV